MRGSVLLVGIDPETTSALTSILEEEGYEVDAVQNAETGAVRLGEAIWDVVLIDVDADDEKGPELLEHDRSHSSFVMLTTLGSIERAVAAIDRGAQAYVSKPIHPAEVRAVVKRGLEQAQLSREAAQLREQLSAPRRFEGLIGDHPSMQEVFRMIQQVAKSRATVLIAGETGTGKELIAAAIHYSSPRKEHPFVRLNCAALAETLLESELFGHEKGAFTGAAVRRAGRFEQADGGTLFLDEVSEIPMPLQIKLLRFLQEREFERVGGNETLRVDVRVIAASNKDLKTLVDEGRFREDLYYRLHVVEVRVSAPPRPAE